AGLEVGRVFVVPLFISEGFFSDQVIPSQLGFEPGSTTQRVGGRTLIYCKPVGTHERMTAVLLARAREVGEQFPFPRAPAPGETTLVVVGHGTEQNENSRRSIERQVELVRGVGPYAAVEAVYLDEAPRVGECYALARTRNLIVAPFFISDGIHTQED